VSLRPARSSRPQETELRTAAWYGDMPLQLTFPPHWKVAVLWPDTPPPVSERDIADALARPVNQARISELGRGRLRPVVIVDDLTRPTPAAHVMPFVLRELEQAGIPAEVVTVVMATGTHGAPPRGAMAKKIGSEASARCRLVVHDDRADLVRLGRTSAGTPVLINRLVAQSDLVIGIGGIYPQHSTGFGGGSKLAVGVLGRRSIAALHYGHSSMEGSYNIDNDFRRDLDEIAKLAGLHTMVSLHVNARREIVRVVSGDHYRYYRDAVAFSRDRYAAPPPGAANVVVSNAYPIDVSLTFMRSKGIIPLVHAAPRASRVLVSACPEGAGHHGLFPFVNRPRFHRQIHVARRLAYADRRALPRLVASGVTRRVRRRTRRRGARVEAPPRRNPIWLYPGGKARGNLPGEVPGMSPVYDWQALLNEIEREQGHERALSAVVYPCASIQVLEQPAPAGHTSTLEELPALD
jgi:lactate racemase